MINSLCISPPQKSVQARQDRNSVDVGTKFSYLKYDLQRSVCALTHYIKQASWIARSPKKVHTVRSAKGLIRMCCCSRTVYPALDSLDIEGKYDQRMLLSECAVAQTDSSLRLSHKMFC